MPTIDVALQTVADNDVKLLLGFQRRFDSNFRTIREKVTAVIGPCSFLLTIAMAVLPLLGVIACVLYLRSFAFALIGGVDLAGFVLPRIAQTIGSDLGDCQVQ